MNIAKSSQWIIAEAVIAIYTTIWGLSGWVEPTLGILMAILGVAHTSLIGICQLHWYTWSDNMLLIASRGRMFFCFMLMMVWGGTLALVLITNSLWSLFALVAVCPFNAVISATAYYANSKVAHALDPKIKTSRLEFRI